MTIKVLYVEDHPASVDIMRRRLQDQDIQLFVAPNGEAGIDLAHRLKPDLILMDINMPGMNGIEAMSHIRDNRLTRHIPIVLMTVSTSERTRVYAQMMGCDDYLVKPVEQADFLETLAQFLPMSLPAQSHQRSA